MKKKNPLYIVNPENNVVEPATGKFDLLIKKYNLQGLLDFLSNLFSLLFEQVNSYPMMKALFELFDRILKRVHLLANFGI
ncbi:hypothetical protein N9N67_07180 [Bacteriovoracaceae bacterium]|nr:hypothetical protein [Bacteriovoracaceae bacterium]